MEELTKDAIEEKFENVAARHNPTLLIVLFHLRFSKKVQILRVSTDAI